MDSNVGGLDRTARLAVGTGLLAASAAAFAAYWDVGVVVGLVLFLAGAALLLTGTTRKCPVNRVAGVDTSE